MAETKRVPTEAEARLLVRDVARRHEDERALGAFVSPVASKAGNIVSIVVLVAAMAGLPYLDRSLPFAVWGVLALLLAAVAGQSVEIVRLTRVTTALARIAERAVRNEPLPRAPSPPAGTP